MFMEYYRHLFKNCVHCHFPDFGPTNRIVVENEKNFIAVLQEQNPVVELTKSNLLQMEKDFLSYIKRRSGSMKTCISTCTGTIGRWSSKRSCKPIMECNYICYDSVYYKNWATTEKLDRLVWSNVIVVKIMNSFCPYSEKEGILFIID